ncbi:MAG: serine/threonine protein kinase [Proteobacteria bacterium]|nr:serine/threonine protein kinase [Pseudomonadota bacterium]
MPYNPGDVLKERYIIEEVLGKGSMGEVYRAKHVTINRQFAIKLMHVHIAEKADSLARFRREANAAAQLDHPHICQVTDFDSTENGDFYLVMEYLKGETLRDRLEREGTIQIKSIFRIMHDLLSALECAHENGIVHRDIKPENISLIKRDDRDDYVKLIDFGIAHAEIKNDNEGTLTQSGQVYGTPQYLSPEQVMGDPVDSRADLYSCGCLLYEMLEGNPPFDADNYIMLLNKHLILDPPHLSVELECAQELDDVIQRMLMKHPRDRFSSAREVRSVLSDIANRFYPSINLPMSKVEGNIPSLETKRLSNSRMKPVAGEKKGRTTISNPYINPDEVGLLQTQQNKDSSSAGENNQKNDESSAGNAKKKSRIIKAAIASGIVLVLLAAALLIWMNSTESDEDSTAQNSNTSEFMSNEDLVKYARTVCPIPEYSPLYKDENLQDAANKCVKGDFEAAYKSLDKLKNDYHESSRFTMMMLFNAYALQKYPVVVRNALSLINIDPSVFCHDAARDIMYSLIESDSTFESLQNGMSYLNPARASEALSWLLLLTPCNQHKKRFTRIAKALDAIEDEPEGESGWLEAAVIMWRPFKVKGTCTSKQKALDNIVYNGLEEECSQLGDDSKRRGRCSLCLNIWKNRRNAGDTANTAGSMPE